MNLRNANIISLGRQSARNTSDSIYLASIAKSLERIATHLGELKDAFLMEHRMRLRESRREKRASSQTIAESSEQTKIKGIDERTPIENIRSILGKLEKK